MITVHYDATGIDGGYFETMRFSAGEQFVKLKNSKSVNKIVWNYEGDEELITLGLIYDIVKNERSHITLDMPYIPHARQDRSTHCTQPYSLKVFVNMLRVAINPMYTTLRVADPHSEVSINLLEKSQNGVLIVKEQYEFAQFFVDKGYDYVVAPDKGAANKTLEWAKMMGVPMFMCNKNRDPSSGWITSYDMPNIDLKNKKILLTDDIIDGGKSIIMVSEILKNKGCNYIDTFATHGIFSKGVDIFTNINHLYTTNTLPHAQKIKDKGCEKLTIFDCFE